MKASSDWRSLDGILGQAEAIALGQRIERMDIKLKTPLVAVTTALMLSQAGILAQETVPLYPNAKTGGNYMFNYYLPPVVRK